MRTVIELSTLMDFLEGKDVKQIPIEQVNRKHQSLNNNLCQNEERQNSSY